MGAAVRRPKREESLIQWLSYRLDRFLHLHPVLQLALVLGATLFLALFFGLVITALGHGDVADFFDGVWWAVTRMLDGGTIAGERRLLHRLIGLFVTLTGLVAVAVLTGAFASSFADRIRVIRQGRIPIFERGHVVLLGWNARGAVILRELALSGIAVTVAVLADQDRDLLEERAREALGNIRHRLCVVVKRGDPTTTAAVRAVSASAARVIAVLPDAGAAGEAAPGGGHRADRAALRSLLAVRRVLRGRRVPVVVEVSCRAGEEIIRLCAGDDEIIAVDARDVNAGVLVRAVQQPGAFDVVRQILSLGGCSIYLHPPGALAGRTFDEIHAASLGAVVIGRLRGDEVDLSPDGSRVLQRDDQLIAVADAAIPPAEGGALPELAEPPPPSGGDPPIRSLHVLVARHKPELASILGHLGDVHAARMTVLVPPGDVDETRRDLAGAHPGGAALEVIGCDPLDPAAIERALALDPDVALLLAPDVSPDGFADADSDQIITLLHLRRLTRARPRPLHVVLELRSPETRRLVAADPDVDFVLAGEIVGMLLAQEIHALHQSLDARRGELYRRILDAITVSIHLRPLSEYAAGGDPPTFARIAAAARARGEIALGVEQAGAAALLLPERELRFDVEGTRVVILRPPGRLASTAAAPAAA